MCHPLEGPATPHICQTGISFRHWTHARTLGIDHTFRPESEQLLAHKHLVRILFHLPRRDCKHHTLNMSRLLAAFPGLRKDGAHIFCHLHFASCMEGTPCRYHQREAFDAGGIYQHHTLCQEVPMLFDKVHNTSRYRQPATWTSLCIPQAHISCLCHRLWCTGDNQRKYRLQLASTSLSKHRVHMNGHLL